MLVMGLLLASTVLASGLSIQLKRTNPGIAKEKSAELIFDVVNTDMDHKITGFLWCRSPDDAVVSGTEGVGSGAAQYVGPKFTIDVGPSQKSMSLTLEADTVGDKRSGCTIKYIPFKEEAGEAVEEEVTEMEEKEVTTEVEVEEEQIVFNEETGENETQMVTVLKNVTETVQEPVTRTVSKTLPGKKLYQKMNAEYIEAVTDSDYREIRLDKTIPFVAKMEEPACPEGKASCNAEEVIDLGHGLKTGNMTLYIIIAIVIIVLLVVYLLGKSSRS